MKNKLIHGDCLEEMKKIPDNSVDSIVTDPPYELGFMGKSWDNTGIANNVEMWAECLRVLKPGGHLLAFGGTRTYHRMASAIEDAGFEVRDMIEWVYGSGFPKSLSVGKAINKMETDEWSKIGKALDNIDQESKMEVWEKYLDNAKYVAQQLSKSKTIAGQDIPREIIVQAFAVVKDKIEDCSSPVNIAKVYFTDHQANETKINTVLQNVEAEIRQLQDPAKFAELLSQNPNPKSWLIFTAECDVKEWLKENTMVNHKVDEVLKTLRGNKKYSNEEIINVLCAVIPSVLKHTILNQSKTFQNLDTKSKMECVSAINATITEYTAEHLISNTVAILKGKAVDKIQGNEREIIDSYKVPDIKGDAYGTMNDKQGGSYKNIEINKTKGTSEWEGWGTALKPAHEPICMARKPLLEKTVAENCIKYGTGGINIDESRVEYQNEQDKKEGQSARPSKTSNANEYALNHGGLEGLDRSDRSDITGRFPANLIHDGSDEVKECFPETKPSQKRIVKSEEVLNKENTVFETSGYKERFEGGVDDNGGNASRFFKSIIYQAKASKSERNKGCEELEDKFRAGLADADRDTDESLDDVSERFRTQPCKNNHPTVKPIALMEYLIKMVTPKGGTVLDPFMGSGTTGIACKNLNRNFIGIELNKEYYEIANKRINYENTNRRRFT